MWASPNTDLKTYLEIIKLFPEIDTELNFFKTSIPNKLPDKSPCLLTSIILGPNSYPSHLKDFTCLLATYVIPLAVSTSCMKLKDFVGIPALIASSKESVVWEAPVSIRTWTSTSLTNIELKNCPFTIVIVKF